MKNKRHIEHVAIIMDGNGRWALKRGLKRSKGHDAGIRNCINIIKNLSELDFKINNISFYVFSTENWKRPVNEINLLFKLIDKYYINLKDTADEYNIKINHLGNLKRINSKLRNMINEIVELTKNNTGTNVNLAFNYGGRMEIIDAINKNKGKFVNYKSFSKRLYLPNLKDPNLIIRTGGEIRLSNFLLWQSAYSELFFTKILWPDFKINTLNKMIYDYIKRDRRYGR